MIWQEGRGRVQEQEFDWKRGRKSAEKDEKGRKRKKRVEKGKKKTGYDKQSAVTENSSSQMCPERCCEPEESSESVRCHVFVISCPVSIRCFMESGSVYSVKMEFHIPFYRSYPVRCFGVLSVYRGCSTRCFRASYFMKSSMVIPQSPISRGFFTPFFPSAW